MHTFTYINPVVHLVSRRTSVNQHHNQDRMIKQIHRVAAEIILQMGSQIIVEVWVLKPVKGNNIAFK